MPMALLTRCVCVLMICACFCTNLVAQPCSQGANALPDTVVVRAVQFSGHRKTKTYILEREMALAAGMRLSKEQLCAQALLSQQQLMNTQLFVEVQVLIQPVTSDTVAIQVQAKERWYIFPVPYFDIVDRSWNEWYVTHKASLKRVNYGAKLKWYNVSGRNDKLDVSATTGYNQQLFVQYSQPFADESLRHGFELGLAYNQQHETNYGTVQNRPQFFRMDDAYVRRNAYLSLGYSYRPGSLHRHYVRFRYLWDQVLDSVLKLNPQFNGLSRRNIHFPEFSYTWEYYKADYNPYPTKGIIVNMNAMIRGLHQDMHMTQLYATGHWAIPLRHKFNLFLQGVATVKLPLEQSWYNLPMFNYGGGPFLRGTEYYVVDGVAGALGRATLRYPLLKFEIRNPLRSKSHGKIPFAFYGKMYADAGYFYQPGALNMPLNNRFARSGGFGIDLVSFYDVVIRFEYSFNQFGEKGLFVHSGSLW